jgi:hypothetical protein
MLIEALEYAVANKTDLTSRVMQSKETFERAERDWAEYTPTPMERKVAGIDSSWNFIPYLGFYLFGVEGVSILSTGAFLTEPMYNIGLGVLNVEEENEIIHDPRLELQSRGMEFEYLLAKESVEKSEYVLIDGSVLARFHDRRKKKPTRFYEYAKDLMKKDNAIFVAKTSASNVLLDGLIGDIYYFNHISSKGGYSTPYLDPIGVTVFYTRVADFTPCLRIEVPGKLDDQEVRGLVDVLSTSSVSGYPYELRIAHERCKVSNEDMERLANILGLNIETGGREVLGE